MHYLRRRHEIERRHLSTRRFVGVPAASRTFLTSLGGLRLAALPAMLNRQTIVALAILLPISLSANPSTRVHPIDLGVLPNGLTNTSFATAINDHGTIVGISYVRSGPNQEVGRAFVWSHGVMTALRMLPGDTISGASGINDWGDIVGYESNGAGRDRAVIWRQGRIAALSPLSEGAPSGAVAINNRGEVVGHSWTAEGQYHAVLWRRDGVVDLGTLPGGTFSDAYAINDRGQVVGWSDGTTPDDRAVMWDHGAVIDLGAPDNSKAVGVNEQGQVAGWAWNFSDAPFGYRAFLWHAGALMELGTLPGGTVSDAYGINRRGEVTGSSDNAAQDFVYAYVVRRGRMVQLPSLPNGGNATGMAINDRGEVVGQAANARGEYHAVLWADRPPHEQKPER